MRRGEEWGSAATGPAELEVAGTDADLARALASAPEGVLVGFFPASGSELARAVGLTGAPAGATALTLDLLRVRAGPAAEGIRHLAVNGVVLGVAPDRLRAWHRPMPVAVTIDGHDLPVRATTVAVMNGQFWRTADLSPRGHPGDGVVEVQVYALPPGQRRAMRARLPRGAHLPHPDITVRRGRRVGVRFPRPVPLEVDGRSAGRLAAVEIEVAPGAYRLLV